MCCGGSLNVACFLIACACIRLGTCGCVFCVSGLRGPNLLTDWIFGYLNVPFQLNRLHLVIKIILTPTWVWFLNIVLTVLCTVCAGSASCPRISKQVWKNLIPKSWGTSVVELVWWHMSLFFRDRSQVPWLCNVHLFFNHFPQPDVTVPFGVQIF